MSAKHSSLLRSLLLTLLLATVITSFAAEEPLKSNIAKTSYTPNFHGALRARYEMALPSAQERFQIRNARVTMDGRIAPTISYYLQTDLCDRGEMKILDAWGRIDLSERFGIQAGQFRLPFGADPFRGPANYIFANRSFIGKEICSLRGVGAKAIYSLPLGPSRKLNIDAGAFNTTVIGNHQVWLPSLSYAAKLALKLDNLTLATGGMSIKPKDTRINLTGASASWSTAHWLVEGEYMYKHYTKSTLDPTHAYLLFADYRFPVTIGAFNQASFQLRGEGHTPHSAGTKYNDEHNLISDKPTRHRITCGSTLTYAAGPLHCDIRLNYEKYIYNSEADRTAAGLDGSDRVLAELVVRF